MEILYKDINEQIELLKQKNILIKNEKNAEEILLRENYYNVISGYKDVFIDIKNLKKDKAEVYATETYFEEIYAVYKFDRQLRNIMLKYISIIETNVKSYISNIFSKKYGTKDYLIPENFNVNEVNKKRFDDFLRKINSNLERNIDNYKDIKICKQEYGDVPLWMLSTIITFGNITKFYIFMKQEDKKQVAKMFNIKHQDMPIFLKMLNIIRNVSAHNNVLFNIKLDIKYPIKSTSYYHDKLNIKNENGEYLGGINDILSIVIILKRFLQQEEYLHFVKELEESINDVKKQLDIESFENFLEDMGIPKEYYYLEIL